MKVSEVLSLWIVLVGNYVAAECAGDATECGDLKDVYATTVTETVTTERVNCGCINPAPETLKVSCEKVRAGEFKNFPEEAFDCGDDDDETDFDCGSVSDEFGYGETFTVAETELIEACYTSVYIPRVTDTYKQQKLAEVCLREENRRAQELASEQKKVEIDTARLQREALLNEEEWQNTFDAATRVKGASTRFETVADCLQARLPGSEHAFYIKLTAQVNFFRTTGDERRDAQVATITEGYQALEDSINGIRDSVVSQDEASEGEHNAANAQFTLRSAGECSEEETNADINALQAKQRRDAAGQASEKYQEEKNQELAIDISKDVQALVFRLCEGALKTIYWKKTNRGKTYYSDATAQTEVNKDAQLDAEYARLCVKPKPDEEEVIDAVEKK